MSMPDLSRYPLADCAAYEWYLSDHPWAVAERTRRLAARTNHELVNAAKLRASVERRRAANDAGEFDDSLDGSRDSLVWAAEKQLRAVLDSAEPDDVRVARLRRSLERRSRDEGDHTYVYPTRLIGPGAAAHPPPGWSGYRTANGPIDEADLTQLPGWETLPADLQKTFTDAHLPSSFLKRDEDSANFIAGPHLRQIDVPPLGRLVRFGSRVGGFTGGDFCVNPATGEVVLAMDRIPPGIVNSSLALFARTVHLASGFEPQFTTGNAEECWIATEDFLDALDQIDPPAAHPDNYWGTFASDVKAGDYSNNEIFDMDW